MKLSPSRAQRQQPRLTRTPGIFGEIRQGTSARALALKFASICSQSGQSGPSESARSPESSTSKRSRAPQSISTPKPKKLNRCLIPKN